MKGFDIDRPITSEEYDRLDRAKFASRLRGALIKGNRSTGVCLGLVGEWGSGKTSVLNLLESDIRRHHPAAVIMRFDPWLISGRDNLIAAFFGQLIAAVRAKREYKHVFGTEREQRIEAALEAMSEYGEALSPLVTLLGGPGWLTEMAGRAAAKALLKKKSLAEKKEEMARRLKSLGFPIIVLIDELDRVDDGDVHMMAQLVRSVADFEEVSYLLAYDQVRVVEALGSYAKNAKLALPRGQAYLEKIVQLQVRIPREDSSIAGKDTKYRSPSTNQYDE